MISQRRQSTYVSLDRETAQDLNDFFGELCTDGDYVEPALLEIGPEVEVPEISERYVWNTLSSLKKTATGPDQIPYWVWKDQAKILLQGSGICLSLRISGLDRGKGQISTHCQKLMFQWREGTSGGST